jgi:external thioesterase TEII
VPSPLAQRYVARGSFSYRVYGQGHGPHRLLGFPPVGGHSLSFRNLAAALGPTVEVIAVDPPGHGFLSSTPLESVEALVELYQQGLPPEVFQGATFFGYSLGAFVAHHLATRIRPKSLILGAPLPYHRRARAYSQLSSPDLFAALVELGGLAPAIRATPELYAHFEPVLRADFLAFEQCSPPKVALTTSTLVMGGREDRLCLPEALPEWGRYLPVESVAMFPGGHFFWEPEVEAVAATVRAWLEAPAHFGSV